MGKTGPYLTLGSRAVNTRFEKGRGNEYARPGKYQRKWRWLIKGLVARRRARQSRGGCTRGDECGVPRGTPAGGAFSGVRGF